MRRFIFFKSQIYSRKQRTDPNSIEPQQHLTPTALLSRKGNFPNIPLNIQSTNIRKAHFLLHVRMQIKWGGQMYTSFQQFIIKEMFH